MLTNKNLSPLYNNKNDELIYSKSVTKSKKLSIYHNFFVIFSFLCKLCLKDKLFNRNGAFEFYTLCIKCLGFKLLYLLFMASVNSVRQLPENDCVIIVYLLRLWFVYRTADNNPFSGLIIFVPILDISFAHILAVKHGYLSSWYTFQISFCRAFRCDKLL